jgi:hypothetical protein
MSQATAAIANMSRTLFRAAVNAALQALQSRNSGATEPAETYAYMPWADTTSGWLKQRNAANSAWIKVRPLGTGAAVDVASATTLDLDAAAASSGTLRITGTTATTAITLADGQHRLLRAAAAWPITHGASLICPGSASYTCAAGDLVYAIGEAAGVVRLAIWKADGTAVVSSAAGGLPRSYLAGCILSNNGGDATNDIDIAAGSCRDSSNTADITVAALTKRLDANWAAGTNQGMRYSGAAIANTTYGIWAVSKADGTQDIYAYPNSGAPSAATVLSALQAETGGASYLYVRRIGCILRASAAILPFKQRGDTFNLATPVLDINNATPGTSSVTVALASVPLGVVVLALMNTVKTASRVYFRALTDVDMAPSDSVAPLSTITSNTDTGANPASVFTDTSAQIAYRSGANTLVVAATLGWIDPRGKDD